MKKLLFLLIPVLALLTACQSGIDQIIPSLRPSTPVFYASIEEARPADMDTKVYVDEQMRVLWNADDRISIFNKKDANLQYRFQGEDGDNAGEFKIVGSSAAGNDIPSIYAVYPYSEGTTIDAEGTLSIMLPAVQPYKAKSFGIGANTMVSVTDDTNLRFKNLGGYLSFKLYGDNVEVKSIRLKGNHGEKLAGAATVAAAVGGAPVATMSGEATETITLDCGKGVTLKASEADYTEFWFVLPPTDFTHGFTITVTDIRGGVYTKSTTNALTISRNTLSRMSPVLVTPDYTNANAVIEDDNFRTYCITEFDKSKDGIIQMDEALLVKKIDVCTDNIESLEGIAFFANLEDLSCKGSESQVPTKSPEMTTVYGGKLKNLDLSHNKKLVRVDCSGNKIETLDVSQNAGLESLNCTNNPITTVNLAEEQVIPTVEIPEETIVVFDWVAPEQGDNEIWYTSTDGNIVEPAYPDRFNAAIVSNTYENGKGIIVFDADLTEIGDAAFWGCNFKTILLPGKLTTITSQVFGACEGLKTLNIPESVTSIGSYNNFGYCDSLVSFTGKFATSDHRALVVDGTMVGFAPGGLTSYTVDNSVKVIGTVFCYCSNLTSIILPAGIKEILTEAFEGCSGLTEIVLPSSLETIGNYVFRDCSSLTSMNIPESVVSIGESCFDDCSALASFTGKYAAGGGRYLQKDDAILAFALAGCSHLEIPEGISETCPIKNYPDLYSIVFPSTISTFGQVMFCNNLDTIVVKATTPPSSFNRTSWTEGVPWLFQGTNDCPILVPAESVDAYQRAQYWSDYADRIHAIPDEQPEDEIWYTTTDGAVAALRTTEGFGASFVSNTYENGLGIIKFNGPVTGITGDDPFSGTKVDFISLPQTAVNLQSGFEGCQYLSSIHFPSHLDYVPAHLIANNEVIHEIHFPETDNIAGNWRNGPIAFNRNLSKVTGPYATADNRSLIKNGKLFAHAGAGFSSYEIPQGVTEVGGEAFAGYKTLQDITVPNSVESIDYLSFAQCTGLTQINLPESVTYIDVAAFEGCTGLVSFHVPANAEIGPELLEGCTSLESLTGRYASDDNRLLIVDSVVYAIAPAGLTSYSIPEGVKGIYSGLGLSSNLPLDTLVLPASLQTVRFICGNNLKTLVSKAEVPPVVSYAWSLKMNNIEAIYVPAASVDAYQRAQYWSEYAAHIQAIPDGQQPDNEIWYTSTDGNPVTPNDLSDFGVSLVSNTYQDTIGIMRFSGPLTVIGTAAFRNCSTLETVVHIGEGVTDIRWGAFGNCSNLVSINLPPHLESLDTYSLAGCAFEEITIPETVIKMSSHTFEQNPGQRTLKAFYGKGASADHQSLVLDGTLIQVARLDEEMDYVVPDGVTNIASEVFYFTHFNSITLPQSLEDFDNNSFRSTLKLSAFYGKFASSDHRCLVKDSVMRAFAHYGLSSYVVTEPVSEIGSNAFSNQNNNIDEITLPETVKKLSKEAFELNHMKVINLPSSLETIEDEAFSSDSYLTRLTIPAAVKSIGSRAFAFAGSYANNRAGMSDITFLSAIPPVIMADTFQDLDTSIPFYVPAASVEAYKTAQYWSDYADRIQPIAEIPDANFRAYVFDQYDINKDGILSQEEKDSVKILQLHSSSISSLDGIELFPHLQKLLCSNNNLTSIDVSHNTELISVACSNNQLTKLDLSNNTALIALSCGKNQLTSLDLSNNPKLELIYCYSNLLTEIKLSTDENRVAIGELDCRDNKFTELNVSDHVISTLDVRNNKLMRSLYCLRCQLSALEVAGDTELVVLNCSDNALTELDLGTNVKLVDLICCDNKLKSLDVSPLTSLDFLHCDNNLLSGLDVSKNSALRVLQCANNSLTALNVDANTNLQTLACGNNQIDSLDVSKNLLLTGFSCSYNLLSSLDVSNHSNLTWLRCENNNLTSIDVSGCSSFSRLYCFDNNLTSLDVSTCLNMSELYCHNNSLLTEIWLKTNQSIPTFIYDDQIAIIKRK